MYIRPKKRLMSITNALATQKYLAYSTDIDITKAKVEEDGVILAGSPYPFSYTERDDDEVDNPDPPDEGGGEPDPPDTPDPPEPQPLYPYRNYLYDSGYAISELEDTFNNPANSYRNVYFSKFSVIHNITGGLTVTTHVNAVETTIRIDMRNSYSQNPVVYHFYIMQDLVQPIDLSRQWTLNGEITSNLDVTNLSTFFTTTNTRNNRTGSFATAIGEKKLGTPPKELVLHNVWDGIAPEGTLAYGLCYGFQGNVRPQQTIEITFKNFMLSEGTEAKPYYPAEEDLAWHVQTFRSLANMQVEEEVVADGLIFEDINVKEMIKNDIKVVTGKLITGGYILEKRLPYAINQASKENLKMIRFR